MDRPDYVDDQTWEQTKKNVAAAKPAPKPKRVPEATDDAIAEAFAEEHRDDLRYVAAWGKWFEWRDGCWREEKTLRAFDLIRKTCRAQGLRRTGMAKMVAAVHALARTDRRLAATIEQWDVDPKLINTPDGVVDLRTGELRRHRPDDYMTMITAVGPRGDCPLFLGFLDRIMGGDETLVAYLQRAFGYCLTGATTEQALFFNYGGGANGKTVLMATVAAILGDYCVATPIETFTESRNDRHPTELARLRGARLVTATETGAGRHWAESRLKELTGGERIPARFMNKDFFEYQPAFKPWLSGNHKPRLRSVGLAMRRRVNMIPFAVTIPENERDPQLVERLKAERPGILQWMVEGCLDWKARGLASPEAVTKATDAYFAAEDGIADWIEERCEEINGFVSRSVDLFASWRNYAEKTGLNAGDIKKFREEMENRGFSLKHAKFGNYYNGLRIRHDTSEEDR